MNENSINNGDGNILSNRDTIINNNIGTLESLILSHIGAKITPALDNTVDEIKKEICQKTSDVIDECFIEPLRIELENKNLRGHFETLTETLKQFNEPTPSIKATTERVEALREWIQGIEKIDTDEAELSKIWENWYIDYLNGKNVSDLKLFLNIMKDLSSDEAFFLLNIQTGEYRNKYSNERNNYIKEALLKKELIKLYTIWSNKVLIIYLLSITISTIVAITVFSEAIADLFSIYLSDSRMILVIFIIIGMISTLYIYSPKKYRLTWIGKEIVAYAKRTNIIKRDTM